MADQEREVAFPDPRTVEASDGIDFSTYVADYPDPDYEPAEIGRAFVGPTRLLAPVSRSKRRRSERGGRNGPSWRRSLICPGVGRVLLAI